jgi:hypothetical protein
VVGGLAKVLYGRLHGFTDVGLPATRTVDVDLAVRIPLNVPEAGTVDGLLCAAGFERQEIGGLDHELAGVRYRHPDCHQAGEPPPYLEFIHPQLGGEPGQKSLSLRRVACQVAMPQTGLVSAPLRYVDLLLHEPVEIEGAWVAHPLAYVVAKNAMRDKRMVGKRERDQMDAYFVITGLQSQWAGWAQRWDGWKEHIEWSSWLSRVDRWWSRGYAQAQAEGARELGLLGGLSVQLRSPNTIRALREALGLVGGGRP